jgi:hypothetical protein
MLFLRVGPAALPGFAFRIVVRLPGDTGLPAKLTALGLFFRRLERGRESAVVQPICHARKREAMSDLILKRFDPAMRASHEAVDRYV